MLLQLFFIKNSCSQINLVKNPSFEDTIMCPNMWGYVDPYVYFWINPTISTPDYYNSCAVFGTGCSVPLNAPNVFQYPFTGNGYCGVFAFEIPNPNERDYIQGQLTDSLIAGEQYTVSFYVNLANFSAISISNMGAYLSSTPISNGSGALLSYIPQIIGTTYIDDTLAWVLIKGDFTALGGERYITIGNFFDDGNTDTLTVYPGSFGSTKISYYYIDEVSVVKKFMIPSIIGGNNIFEINGLPDNCILYLYNTLGQIVYKNENYKNDFNSINLRSGIYYYYVELLGKEIHKGKLCINH